MDTLPPIRTPSTSRTMNKSPRRAKGFSAPTSNREHSPKRSPRKLSPERQQNSNISPYQEKLPIPAFRHTSLETKRTDSIDDLPPNPYRDDRIVFMYGTPVRENEKNESAAAFRAFRFAQKREAGPKKSQTATTVTRFKTDKITPKDALPIIKQFDPSLGASPYCSDPRKIKSQNTDSHITTVQIPTSVITPFLSNTERQIADRRRRRRRHRSQPAERTPKESSHISSPQKSSRKHKQKSKKKESWELYTESDLNQTEQPRVTIQSKMYRQKEHLSDWRGKIREEVWSDCFARIEARLKAEEEQTQKMNSMLNKNQVMEETIKQRAQEALMHEKEQKLEKASRKRKTQTELRRADAKRWKKHRKRRERRQKHEDKGEKIKSNQKKQMPEPIKQERHPNKGIQPESSKQVAPQKPASTEHHQTDKNAQSSSDSSYYSYSYSDSSYGSSDSYYSTSESDSEK
ncbi:hypothetical protein BLNAU_13916 [Blattamonas nauphoetae]|uniref:Uncharacterized protein n=1 Tax=Blattamonas nauphoetae TaxID=2049346 RepID=A0ABQ9XFD5_9EUKA|nr:hypothetical protein BLNAU_13916 [Blattamonas nauphoetae]